EVEAHLAEVCSTTITRETISKVTDRVMGELTDWQNRPPERVYPVVFIDAIAVKIRDGQVANRPVHAVNGSLLTANATSSGCGSAPVVRAPSTGCRSSSNRERRSNATAACTRQTGKSATDVLARR
ncbi:MAG: putative transposase for insertion sequence element ISRM3-like protein, partial [Acidimicrobiales bacterium]|nr:putative transposase for insertion sequence element ISRM3-like protein [Acidimicrobiales bacterium]